MKEIYVMKEFFGGAYRAVSKEEIDQLVERNRPLIGIDIDCGYVIVHLYEDLLFYPMDESTLESKYESLAKDYVNYVMSITGMEPDIE